MHSAAPAHGVRSIAARLNGTKFVTSWHKGFREQNLFKRLYNGIMARGDRIIASSEQIAQLINDRYGTAWDKIKRGAVQYRSERFNPEIVTRERIGGDTRHLGVHARHQG